MPKRISMNISAVSVAAGESVPSPTRRPELRKSCSGARPMPSWALQRVLTATATSYCLSFLTSSSSTCTQWTARTLVGLEKASQFSA